MPPRPQRAKRGQRGQPKSDRRRSRRRRRATSPVASSARPDDRCPAALDPNEIFASVGDVPYEWRLDTDALAWGANAARRAGGPRPGADRQRRAPTRGWSTTRTGARAFDAVMQLRLKDDGAGVPYRGAIRAAADAGLRAAALDRGHRPLVRRRRRQRRRAPTASCASSTSATSASSGSPICRASTRSPAR